MLPKTVLDGIIKYVTSTVGQHIRTKDEKWRYTETPIIMYNDENELMILFHFKNRPLDSDCIDSPTSEEE